MIVWQIPLAALAISLSLGAIAQPVKQGNPADSNAPVPSTKYESAFSGYRPYQEEKLRPWRDVNESVGRADGHGTTGTASSRTAPSSAPPARNTLHEHGGHPMQNEEKQ